MTSASQAARAERNAAKAKRCGKVLRISSVEDGKRFWGRPEGDCQRPFATIFHCEEMGNHVIHRQAEELEDGTLIDIQWADKDQSQYKNTPNPLLEHPKLGKWLPRKTEPVTIKQVRKPAKVSIEDW